MAQNKANRLLTIGAAGTTTTFAVTDSVDIYDIKASGGTVVLAGNVSITASGSPSTGTTYTLLLGGGFTLGANTFTVFGVALTAAQVLYKQHIVCYYNGTTWDVYILQDNTTGSDDIDGGDIVDGTIVNSKILTGTIALTKLASSALRGYAFRSGVNGVPETFRAETSGNIMMGNGTDVVSQTMSGDATISGTGVLTLATNSVITADITDANVTVAKVSADLKSEVLIIPCSFQTGEVGVIRYKMPYPGSIVDIYAIATTAIAATDNGTVTLQNNAGTTMTVTTPIVFTASDPYGTAYTSAVTANNTFVAGDILRITTAKVTAGGRVLLSLKVTRS